MKTIPTKKLQKIVDDMAKHIDNQLKLIDGEMEVVMPEVAYALEREAERTQAMFTTLNVICGVYPKEIPVEFIKDFHATLYPYQQKCKKKLRNWFFKLILPKTEIFALEAEIQVTCLYSAKIYNDILKPLEA